MIADFGGNFVATGCRKMLRRRKASRRRRSRWWRQLICRLTLTLFACQGTKLTSTWSSR